MVRGASLWSRHFLVESLVFSLQRAPRMWPYLLFLGELLTQLAARNSPVGTVPHLWFHMCCFKHFLFNSVIFDSWEKKENTGTRNHLTQKEISRWAYGKMNRQLIFRNWRRDNNVGLEKDPEPRGKAVNWGKLNHQYFSLSVFTVTQWTSGWVHHSGAESNEGCSPAPRNWFEWVSECHSVVSTSLRPHRLYSIEFTRLEYWSGIAVPFSRGSFQPRDQTQVSLIADGFFTSRATREARKYWSG